MASSVSGQDEPTHTLWLATRVGKMELSCPLRTNHSVLREKFPQKSNTCTVIQNCKSFISQAFSVKMAGYWPCSSLFLRVYGPWLCPGPWTCKKELGQCPAILTKNAWSRTHIYGWVLLILTWCYGWNLIEFTHKLTSLIATGVENKDIDILDDPKLNDWAR